MPVSSPHDLIRRQSSARLTSPPSPVRAELFICGGCILGRPFSAAGFGNWFRDRCDEADLHHCSAHGLRKAGATIAAENGATDRQLMAMYDWKTEKQATPYTAAASRKLLASAAAKALGADQIANVKMSHLLPHRNNSDDAAAG
jgi:hypothetical protein